MTVTLQNRFPEIIATLNPKLDVALGESAHEIEAKAKLRAPVATGRLRDAIHTDRTSQMRYRVVAGDDDVFYAHFLEFGTVHGPAHPFLIPAFEESVDDALRRIQIVLQTL